MNKGELIGAYYEACKADIPSRAAAARQIDALIDIVNNAVKSGEGLHVSGLGSLEVVKRAPRTCVNPRTGEPIKVKASKAVKFKPSKTMKEAASHAKVTK